MHEISDKTLKESYKPYDVVQDKYGNVGFINEININSSQPEPNQISYSVEWMVGNGQKSAWYSHSELTKHCNIFVKIAKCSASEYTNNRNKVEKLMSFGL